MGSTTAYTPLTARVRQSLVSASEHFNDEKMSQYPLLLSISNRIDRPPFVLAHCSLLILLSVLLLNPNHLSPVLTNLLGLLPAFYLTFKHLHAPALGLSGSTPPMTPGLQRKRNDDAEWAKHQTTRWWMDYWVVYGTSVFVESTLGEDTVLALVPLWWAFKAVGLVWALVSYGEGETGKERARPKPLRLKPRSKNPQQVAVSSPSPSPEHKDTAQLLAARPSARPTDGDDESEGTTAVESPTPSSAQLRDMRAEMRDITPPALSAPPVNMTTPVDTPRSEVGSERSEPFGLTDSDDDSDSEESDSGSDSDDSDSDSDSESSDGTPSDGSGSGTASSTGSPSVLNSANSDESSDSNDAILPPDTPLDELALADKLTLQLPKSGSELSEEHLKMQALNAKELGSGSQADGEGAVEVELGGAKEKPKLADISTTSPIASRPAFTNPPAPAQSGTTPAPRPTTASTPGSGIATGGADGEVTRLTLDDLLAMEGDGSEMEEGVVGEVVRGEKVQVGAGIGTEGKGYEGGGVLPLNVGKKEGVVVPPSGLVL
ncbi:hypothetical protein IAT38_006846 [Cryptococcus sp. DSM 104549]